MNIRQAAHEGARVALAAFGLPSQPSLPSVGIKPPAAPGLPKPGAAPSRLSPMPGGSGGGGTSSGIGGAGGLGKLAFNVGLGMSNSSSGAGAVPGEPVDAGRRQRSVIDRTFQANEDNFATSSMPLPGNVSP